MMVFDPCCGSSVDQLLFLWDPAQSAELEAVYGVLALVCDVLHSDAVEMVRFAVLRDRACLM